MSKPVSTYALAFLAALAFACSDPKPEQSAVLPPQQSATDSATHPGSPGGAAVVTDIATGTTVLAVVTEGSIAVRGQAIPPGPAVVTVQNGGKEVHNLFVEGEGISRAAGDNIAPGATQSVDVLLRPGTYTFYCPVMNHRDLGEQIAVTVGTATDTDAAVTSGS